MLKGNNNYEHSNNLISPFLWQVLMHLSFFCEYIIEDIQFGKLSDTIKSIYINNGGNFDG